MSPHDDVASAPSQRGGRRAGRLAWAVAIVATVALLLGGVMVAAAITPPPPPHHVLEAQFSTASFLPNGAVERTTVELWTDPTLARARLNLAGERTTLYYLRDAAGTWYSVGRASPQSPWRRSRLDGDAAPSLADLSGIRALFARLRAQAQKVTGAGLHNRMAVAFPATVLTWPYRYSGRATVWLDGVTGLPLQFRSIVAEGTSRIVVITVVKRIHTVASSALPAGFFTPPDQHPSLWDMLVSRIRGVASV